MNHRNSKNQFLDASRAILNFASELTPLVQLYSAEVSKRADHHGTKYGRAVVAYTEKINALETQYAPKLQGVAEQVTALGSNDWDARPEIIALWHQLAIAVTSFSEHPTKKVATLIIGEANELEAFGANRVPAGVQKRGSHYVQGMRKNYIVCSERIALSKILGLEARVSQVKGLTSPQRELLAQEAIAALSQNMIASAKNITRLRKSTLISTTTPCDPCLDVIEPFHPRRLYGDSRAGINYTRDVGFTRARQRLEAQGIPLIDLAL